MSDDLARLRDRVSQDRTTRDAAGAAESAAASSSRSIGGASFVPGERVFDRASGIEGDVVTVTRQNLVTPAPKTAGTSAGGPSFQLPKSETVDVVMVRLATGFVVPRHADELVKRPTPPRPGP